MSKYFVPVDIEGKWWVVENAPEEKDFVDDGKYFYIMGYCAALEACTKYPTLESDAANWESKEGVKMGEDEFEVRAFSKVSEETADKLLHQPLTISGIETLAKQSRVTYAIPIQHPTTKELIEQEMNCIGVRRKVFTAFDKQIGYQYLICNSTNGCMGKWTNLFGVNCIADTHDCKEFARNVANDNDDYELFNVVISLPKQDNGDAWDEVAKRLPPIDKDYEMECLSIDVIFTDGEDFLQGYYDYSKSMWIDSYGNEYSALRYSHWVKPPNT